MGEGEGKGERRKMGEQALITIVFLLYPTYTHSHTHSLSQSHTKGHRNTLMAIPEYGPASAKLRSVKTALLPVSAPCFPVRSPAEHSSWLEGEQLTRLLVVEGRSREGGVGGGMGRVGRVWGG